MKTGSEWVALLLYVVLFPAIAIVANVIGSDAGVVVIAAIVAVALALFAMALRAERFSLRTLLIATTLFAILLGTAAYWGVW
jgi:hypothetical protein